MILLLWVFSPPRPPDAGAENVLVENGHPPSCLQNRRWQTQNVHEQDIFPRDSIYLPFSRYTGIKNLMNLASPELPCGTRMLRSTYSPVASRQAIGKSGSFAGVGMAAEVWAPDWISPGSLCGLVKWLLPFRAAARPDRASPSGSKNDRVTTEGDNDGGEESWANPALAKSSRGIIRRANVSENCGRELEGCMMV